MSGICALSHWQPPVPPCLLHLYSHLNASGCNLTHLYVPY
ncbi:hypothetical protein HMPREF9540_01636 [Escherichia coli MS 115-1]|nr:hypothetical protein HMPREF9540_01636 [Escherichia coli MS 115-1]